MFNVSIGNYLKQKYMSSLYAGDNFIAQQINHFPKDNLIILDVGCGDGIVTKRILNKVNKKYTVYGIDLMNKNEIDKDIIYTKAFLDNKDLPYKDNTFDIVYSNQVIEHIIHKDKLIRECRRVLKKGGYCMFATENVASFDNILSVMLGQDPIAQHSSSDYWLGSFLSPHFMEKYDLAKHGYHMGHKNVSSYYGLQRLMRVNGFKNAKIASFGHINKLFEKAIPFQNRIIVGYAIK